jgi:FlaA1/EpsC-like NDP-sugar epimerase
MNWGPKYKNSISFFIDSSIAFCIPFIGLYLRLGDLIFSLPPSFLLLQSIFLTISVLISHLIFRVHKVIWRYFGINSLLLIIKSATLSTFIFLLISFIGSRLEQIPRLVVLINWALLIILISAPRILYRAYREKTFNLKSSREAQLKKLPIILIGIGREAEIFLNEYNKLNQNYYYVVGILDNKKNVGRLFLNIPILGEIGDLEKVVAQLSKKNKKPARIIITSESYLGGQLKQLLKASEKLSIPVSKINKITDLEHTSSSSLQIKSIPIEDLLLRPQRTTDFTNVANMIKNKKILITGAGGSIGSEIVRQVAANNPQEICLLDSSEFLLYEIEQEIKPIFPRTKILTKLVDIRDKKTVQALFKNFKADIVFHAAALKHVPLLESHKVEAVLTNIFGTKNILDSALTNKVNNFIFISTDKAVDPLSFMGATKRLAELYCQSHASNKTNITIVRFGNVLGSNGSVVPLFKKQISAGRPVTITHPDATRYFMTISEAVGLVLQAATIQTYHSAQIFVLDMGQPIKIIDLAKHMIQLAGLKPEIDIPIQIIGLRPGEKIHETLFYEHEKLNKTEYIDIFQAHPKKVNAQLIEKTILELKEAISALDEKSCLKIIQKTIKKFL